MSTRQNASRCDAKCASKYLPAGTLESSAGKSFVALAHVSHAASLSTRVRATGHRSPFTIRLGGWQLVLRWRWHKEWRRGLERRRRSRRTRKLLGEASFREPQPVSLLKRMR